MKIFYLLASLLVPFATPAATPERDDTTIVLDDFEADAVGKVPARWEYFSSRKQRFLPAGPQMDDDERFVVAAENGNKFLRAYTSDEAQRISLPTSELNWNLAEYPRLRWKWRAKQLPVGAREDKVNDSGGAMYVSFSKKDWLGRPYSIKYVYSSTLPVGTMVSTGNVKIIVVSSGADGIGRWLTIDRDVAADYRKVFGDDPPNEPFTLTIWSDSDNTHSVAEVDFDDIAVRKR